MLETEARIELSEVTEGEVVAAEEYVVETEDSVDNVSVSVEDSGLGTLEEGAVE